MIEINLNQQCLYLNTANEKRCYKISSSKHGHGSLDGSYKTPLGLHKICEIIGVNSPMYTQFRSRIPNGIAPPDTWGEYLGKDLILSRIIRIAGCEPGINRGEGVDSYLRYIYIHGTHEEALLGTPASKGCIRMANDDIVSICKLPLHNMPVNIILGEKNV